MAYSLTWNVSDYDFSEEVSMFDWTDATEIRTEHVPRRHGALVTEEVTMAPRHIAMKGMIVKSTAALARARADLLSKSLNSGAKQLRFNSARYITAYKEDLNFKPVDGTALSAVEYMARFFAADPFFYNVSQTTNDVAIGASPFAFTETNSGDALVYPKLTITADAGAAFSAITITNNTTGKSFSYSPSVSAGNSLIIDMSLFTLTNNAVSDLNNVSTTSTWLWLNSGANSMTFTYTGTAPSLFRIAYNQKFFVPSFD